MREKDVHKLIEQQESEAKQRMYEKIRQRVNLPQPATPQQKPRRVKIKWAVLSSVLACVIIALAVVLPITLRNNDSDGPRFCDSTQYVEEKSEQTLKQYAAENGVSILYVDWYDVAESVQTKIAYNVNDREDIIFLNESIIDGETGYKSILFITDNSTSVDILRKYETCNEKLSVGGAAVEWTSNSLLNFTYIKFAYKNFTYYIELDVAYDEQQIVDFVADMLAERDSNATSRSVV